MNTSQLPQWTSLTGLDRLMAMTSGRESLTVGIIDGPVDLTHPDFAGANVQVLGSRRCEAPESLACQHGTFVTGMLAAPRGSGVPALCPSCHFVVHPIFCETSTADRTCPEAKPEDLAVAIQKVIQAGASVINLSMALAQSFDPACGPLTEALDQARRQGILIIAATGNQGRMGHIPLFRHPWVIPVAACDTQGRFLPTSNSGPSVGRHGLMAPGTAVISTAPGGGNTTMNGTSVAAPWVTGAAALLWSLFPQATAASIRRALLRPSQRRRNVTPPCLDAQESLHYLDDATQRTSIQRRPVMEPQTEAPTVETQDAPPLASTSPIDNESPSEALLEPARSNGQSAAIEPVCGCATPAKGASAARPAPSYIYALGSIEARFPTLDVDREFAQAVQEGETANLTDQEVFYRILSQAENRYLLREMCFVFSVEHIDTYVLVPRSDTELLQLVEAIKPGKGIDVDAVIGTRGPLATPDMCNGLEVPIVIVDRVYSFDVGDFVGAIPQPPKMKGFEKAARELFERIMQVADNAGELDEHRAVNYLAMRYAGFYAHAVEMIAADKMLADIEVRPSRLGAGIVDVIATYIDRKTGVSEQFFVRVNVQRKYPFLVSPLQPYFNR